MAEGSWQPKVGEAFNAYFKDVEWPADPSLPRGRVNARSWNIRYLLEQEGDRTVLQIYGKVW